MTTFKQFLTEAKASDAFAPWHVQDFEKLEEFVIKEDLKRYGWNEESIDNYYPNGWESKKEDWKKTKDNRNIRFNKNATITFQASTQTFWKYWCVDGEGGKVMGFKVQNAKKLIIKEPNLVSVWGMPDKAVDLDIYSDKLKTLEHLNVKLDGWEGGLTLKTPDLEKFDCNVDAKKLFFVCNTKLRSLHNIHKHFKLSSHIGFNNAKIRGGQVTEEAVTFDSHLLGIMLIEGGLKTVSTNGNQTTQATPFMIACSIIDKHLKSQDHDLADCAEDLMTNDLYQYAKI